MSDGPFNQETTSFRLWDTAGFKVTVFVAGAIVLGAILAPPLFWGGKHVVEQGWIREVPLLEKLHGSMDRAQFSRYFNRALVLSALLLLFPTLRWLNPGGGERRPLRERLQLVENPRWAVDLGFGFVLAAIPLLLLGWAYVQLGWYQSREANKALGAILISALGTAFAVSFLEEFVFRGALTAIFSRILRPWPLLLSVAVFFAAVHFLKPPASAEITEVRAWSGFAMLGIIFGQFRDWYFLAAEFAVLFAIGWVLGYTRMKTGSLWLAIGLHAGWVFGVKTLSPMTARNFEPAAMMPWLGDTLRVGLVSCLVVCVTGVVVWWYLRDRSSEAK